MISLISSSLTSIVLIVLLIKFGKIKLSFNIPFINTAETFGPSPAVRYTPREYPIDSVDTLPV